MRTIGFDSATDDTAVAALDGDEVIYEQLTGPEPGGRPAHSRELLPAIGAAVESLGGWGAVDRIAVGVGPGTFTGLRIAISTALGLAMSTDTPAVGISTLEAMAHTLSDGSGVVVPVLDAKRGEVFTAAYGASGEELLPAAAVSPEESIESIVALSGPVRAGGAGAVRFGDLFAAAGIKVEDPGSVRGRLRGIFFCELGAAADAPDPKQPLEPIYIREPDAKVWLERDSGRPVG